MPARSAETQKRHTKQRRKKRAIAAVEDSGSSSPLQSGNDSSEDGAETEIISAPVRNRIEIDEESDSEASESEEVTEAVTQQQISSSKDVGAAKEAARIGKEPRTKKRKRKEKERSSLEEGATEDAASNDAVTEAAAPAKPKDINSEFDAFYLRQVTAEFGNDLEKLRQAPDFKDAFVPVLVKALRQGASLFSESEKKLVLGMGDGNGLLGTS